MGEESKESVIGRRDIFRLPGDNSRSGRDAPFNKNPNVPGRPPLQNRRPPLGI